MQRSECPRCLASVLVGQDHATAFSVTADVWPVNDAEEAAVLLESIRVDGWPRRRRSYDLFGNGRGQPAWIRYRGSIDYPTRGAMVVVDHRCGRWPACRLEVEEVIPAAENEPPFTPYADRYPDNSDPGELAAALMMLAPGPVELCRLCRSRQASVTGTKHPRIRDGYCDQCRPHLHGRIYKPNGSEEIGWCEVSNQHGRRRAVRRNSEGRWICEPCNYRESVGATA
jgi:hypothetical protein